MLKNKHVIEMIRNLWLYGQWSLKLGFTHPQLVFLSWSKRDIIHNSKGNKILLEINEQTPNFLKLCREKADLCSAFVLNLYLSLLRC